MSETSPQSVNETSSKSADPQRQNPSTSTAETSKDPFREILDKLEKAQQAVAKYDRPLSERIEDLARQATDPLRANQRSFQHEVAYAFQDAERKAGSLPVSPEARTEITRLAGSAPGLDNERMLTLMRSTTGIDDAEVREIRRAGAEIGRQVNQDTPDIRSQIEVLENRVRLAERAPEANAEQTAPSTPQGAGQAATSPERPGGSAQERPTNPERPDTTQGTKAAEWAEGNARAQAQAQQTSAGQPGFIRTTGLDAVMGALRGGGASTGAPWDPLPTPFGARLSAFESNLLAGRDEITLRDAERSGRLALDALEGFRTGEGATVMNRIQAAARSDPGGMAAVLSEMREGGRFADLRQQFNNALTDEKGFARAYDQAASALAQYGQARTGIDQIISRRQDATNLSAKFEQLDAQMGEAAGSTPSRREGRNMLDDIAKQAAEIVQRAVDAVRSLFTRSAPEAGSRPGASPSPGA